jgi:hypothetical protein
MITGNISWGVKAACTKGWQPYHSHVPTVVLVMKSGNLNFLVASGPVQACARNKKELYFDNPFIVAFYVLFGSN